MERGGWVLDLTGALWHGRLARRQAPSEEAPKDGSGNESVELR